MAETDSVKSLYSVHSDVYCCLGTLNLTLGVVL